MRQIFPNCVVSGRSCPHFINGSLLPTDQSGDEIERISTFDLARRLRLWRKAICAVNRFFWGELFLFCYIADRQNCVSGSTARRVQPRIESQQNYGWLFKQPNKSALLYLFFRLCCVWFTVIQMRFNNRPACFIVGICPCLAVASFDITCRSPFIKVLKRGKSQQMFVYNSRRRIIIIETNVIHSFVLTLNTFDGFVFYDVWIFVVEKIQRNVLPSSGRNWTNLSQERLKGKKCSIEIDGRKDVINLPENSTFWKILLKLLTIF